VWAVSQATALRRIHVKSGGVNLFDPEGGPNEWASGGFIADSKIDGTVVSGSQQQFLTRNVTMQQWSGGALLGPNPDGIPMFPIVGQQVTLTTDDASTAAGRIALFEAQATAGNCDLIVRGTIAGRERGFVFTTGAFATDRSRAPALSDRLLQALVGTLTPSLTFTCVPPGSGWRLGIDRDGDGYADGDEIAAGSDPADPKSVP
jgi:hypothetical protein